MESSVGPVLLEGSGAKGSGVMTNKLDTLLAVLQAGQPVPGSTSEMCAVGLAADRADVLPAPYTTLADAWRRLNDQQRQWVREKNPKLSDDAAAAAECSGTAAWH